MTRTRDTPDSCSLCQLPTPEEPVTAADVDGTFCCRGCLSVQRSLGTLGGDEATSVRDAIEQSTGGVGESGSTTDRATTDSTGSARDSSTTGDTVSADGEVAFFAVDGMHCTTCEAFLEGRARTMAGVRSVTASYATGTIRVQYDPAMVDVPAVATHLSGYGYAVRERANDGEVGDTRSADDGSALVTFLVGGGLFGMMVMVWYALFLYPTYFGYDPLVEFGAYDGLYVAANIWLMTSFVLFYTGWPILRGAYVSLRAGLPNMDLLVSLAALSAYAYSTLAMVLGRTDLYFDVSVAIILVVTAGTYVERRLTDRAIGRLTRLTESQTEAVRRADDGRRIPRSQVDPGEELLVRPGERLPFDGEVQTGSAAVDESLITGESHPVTKSPGDRVRGGTVVTDAPLVISVGAETESTLDRIVDRLWDIQSSRRGVQRLADRLATIFVPLVIVVATVVTGLLLLSGSSLSAALLIGLTVLIVSCPCALGLATPLAVASGVRTALDRGIVMTAASVFEDAPDVDVVVLDKTGTLTAGTLTVERVVGDPEVLHRAAAVEAYSEHPIARAIVSFARHHGDGREFQSIDSNGTVPDGGVDRLTDADSTPRADPVADTDPSAFTRHDTGVSAPVAGVEVIVGHPSLLRNEGLEIPADIHEQVVRVRADGDVPVVVGWDGRARGVIVVGDAPRPEWREAIDSLATDADVVVLTGDEGAAADRFRAVDGVSTVFAGVPPAGKAETIRRLRRRGTVAMVGDGSNDAPALAAADVGIALGSGTALATDAADAVIIAEDLRLVSDVFSLARGTNRRIRQNLGWAFVYNGLAIPMAIAGVLNPLLAAIAMACSSALVVVNSARSPGE